MSGTALAAGDQHQDGDLDLGASRKTPFPIGTTNVRLSRANPRANQRGTSDLSLRPALESKAVLRVRRVSDQEIIYAATSNRIAAAYFRIAARVYGHDETLKRLDVRATMLAARWCLATHQTKVNLARSDGSNSTPARSPVVGFRAHLIRGDHAERGIGPRALA